MAVDERRVGEEITPGPRSEVELLPMWPGLGQRPDQIVFDTDRLGAVARKLQIALDAVVADSRGTPAAIQNSFGATVLQELGVFSSVFGSVVQSRTARNAADYHGEVVRAMLVEYQNLVDTVQAAVSALRASMRNLADSEDASLASARQVGVALDGGSVVSGVDPTGRSVPAGGPLQSGGAPAPPSVSTASAPSQPVSEDGSF